MTDRLEREAESMLARIDRAGGTLAAIETGLIQREIQESAYRAQLAVDSGAAVVVGVNKFAEAENGAVPLFSVDADVERRQIDRVRAVRAGRSASDCRTA